MRDEGDGVGCGMVRMGVWSDRGVGYVVKRAQKCMYRTRSNYPNVLITRTAY